MNVRRGMGAFVGALLYVSQAAAQDVEPPQRGAPSADAARASFSDAAHAVRALRDLAVSLLARVVDGERAQFERVADRYAKLVELTKRLEARDAADFDARAERYEMRYRFTRELEAEQAEREANAFREHFELFLRETAFTKALLERRKAESAAAGPDSRSDSDRSHFYGRE